MCLVPCPGCTDEHFLFPRNQAVDDGVITEEDSELAKFADSIMGAGLGGER